MKIFLDGKIFSMETLGGISRIYLELLPRMVQLDSSTHYILYLPRNLKAVELPKAPRIQHLHEHSIKGRKGIFRKRPSQDFLLQQAYLQERPDLFHSVFFTYPQKDHHTLCHYRL